MRPSNKAQRTLLVCDFDVPNLSNRLIITVADQATARWWLAKAQWLPGATPCRQQPDQTSQSSPASQWQVGLLVPGGVGSREALFRPDPLAVQPPGLVAAKLPSPLGWLRSQAFLGSQGEQGLLSGRLSPLGPPMGALVSL